MLIFVGGGTYIDLEYVEVCVNLERVRVAMYVRAVAHTGGAIRCLYPEPGTACVKDELVWLSLTAKVHSAEDLNVEEVGQVLLQEALVLCT